MSLKLNERYPARFNNPTAGYPQGSFKNRTTPTAKDGSYLEKDWANDKEGFFQSLLSAAGITANGAVDSVGASQYYSALTAIIGTLAPNPPDASTTTKGVVELATSAETQTGTDAVRAVTPAGLAATTGTETRSGVLKLATQAEALARTESTKAMSAIRVDQAISARLAAEYSAQYTIAPGSLFAITHSKGIDASVEFVYVCLTADAGYSVGDELEIKDYRYSPSGVISNYGVFITSRTATGFIMALAAGTNGWVFPHKTTTVQTAIIVARWAVKARIKP